MAEEVVTSRIDGGKKLNAYLHKLASRLSDGGTAKVGFLPGANYEDGTPVAQVAFWNEFGTTNDDGGEHTPPRPFFRNMVEVKSPGWPRLLGEAARYSGYRARQTLEIAAAKITGELVESINEFSDPPNADATIAKKGYNKPLIDTAYMLSRTSWLVEEGKPVKE